ncbi:hypothetical protein ACH5RR_008734 [Cinchona calisaya]|uniref:FACT complex subunit n=1 Tax=Cinchona calisaya TaxID=153742 RepID=A0ABD3AG14_9GENT
MLGFKQFDRVVILKDKIAIKDWMKVGMEQKLMNELERRKFLRESEGPDNLSNFSGKEKGNIAPDSTNQSGDLMRKYLRGKMFTYRPGDDIEFENGMLFTNVDPSRVVLKDYVIHTGFLFRD